MLKPDEGAMLPTKLQPDSLLTDGEPAALGSGVSRYTEPSSRPPTRTSTLQRVDSCLTCNRTFNV